MINYPAKFLIDTARIFFLVPFCFYFFKYDVMAKEGVIQVSIKRKKVTTYIWVVCKCGDK